MLGILPSQEAIVNYLEKISRCSQNSQLPSDSDWVAEHE